MHIRYCYFEVHVALVRWRPHLYYAMVKCQENYSIPLRAREAHKKRYQLSEHTADPRLNKALAFSMNMLSTLTFDQIGTSLQATLCNQGKRQYYLRPDVRLPGDLHIYSRRNESDCS